MIDRQVEVYSDPSGPGAGPLYGQRQDYGASASVPLVIDGQELTVDLELDRATLERLTLPLCDRAVDVCLGLLRQHGVAPGQLAKVVLVGGPTLMPLLRQRVAARLEAPLAEGHDPMTLVAQGAALI